MFHQKKSLISSSRYYNFSRLPKNGISNLREFYNFHFYSFGLFSEYRSRTEPNSCQGHTDRFQAVYLRDKPDRDTWPLSYLFPDHKRLSKDPMVRWSISSRRQANFRKLFSELVEIDRGSHLYALILQFWRSHIQFSGTDKGLNLRLCKSRNMGTKEMLEIFLPNISRTLFCFSVWELLCIFRLADAFSCGARGRRSLASGHTAGRTAPKRQLSTWRNIPENGCEFGKFFSDENLREKWKFSE